MRKYLLYAAAASILASCGTSVHDYSFSDMNFNQKDATVMLFFNGSDLENSSLANNGVDYGSNASKNIKEMLAAPDLGRVNVLLCTGGCEKDSSGPISSWRTVKRHVIKQGQVQEVADIGAVSMDDPRTLSDFVVWGESAYPAKKYIVVMWDHGGSYNGFGADQVVKRDPQGMSQPEIFQAFRDAFWTTGIKLDMIGFDACLMASDEVVSGLAPYTKTMVVSEELEPSQGWSYTPWLTSLQQNSTQDMAALGRVICDSFLQKNLDLKRTGLTLSVLNTELYPRVEKARIALAQALISAMANGDSATIKKVMLSRLRCKGFAQNMDVDVIDWMDKVKAAGIFMAEASELQEATRQMVLYSVHDAASDFAHGMAIFFPHSFSKPDDYNVYKNIVYPVFRDMVVQLYTYGQSWLSNTTFADLSLSGGELTGKLTSVLGFKSIRLVATTVDPSTQDEIPYDLAIKYDLDPMDEVNNWDFALGINNTVMSWDGHRLPPDVRDDEGETLIPAEIDGTAGHIKVSRDDTGLYVEGFIPKGTGRVSPIDDNDSIQLLVQEYDKTTKKVELRSFGSTFTTATEDVQENPLPTGNYYLAVEVTDLLGHTFLSNTQVPISF